MALSKVWVIVETDETSGSTALTSLSKELLTKARSLGDTVEAVYPGDPSVVAAEAGAYGAATVHGTGDMSAKLIGAPLGAAIAAAADGVDVVLGGTTYDGRDTVAALGVKVGKPVLTNCTDIELDGDAIVGTEPIFGGDKLVRTKLTAGAPMIALVRPKSFPAEESGGGPAATNQLTIPDDTPVATVLNTHIEEREGPMLDDATIVVSGGRGLGDPSKYEEYIEPLGKALGAATGATRAIVDAGWVPYAKQVGQTGKVVKPDVYIAVGISGATQHLVGMKGSKNIIAINKDAEAPIFSVADLGIVGDVNKVLPQLLEALKSR